ncbi:MAG: hypothetical protein OMOMHJEC_00447 [Xanthomonadales bacterium]|nr:hypothetical protein [Xanthomonadales bacterium]
MAEEAHERGRIDRFDLAPQPLHGHPVDACEQVALAPLDGPAGAAEIAAHGIALAFQADQRRLDGRARQRREAGEQGVDSDRSEPGQARAQHIDQRSVGLPGLRGVVRRRIDRGLQAGAGSQRAPLRDAFGGDPHGGRIQPGGAARAEQLRQQRRPALARDLVGIEETEADQRLVQLVGVARLRPGIAAHLFDGRRIQPAEVLGLLRVHPAARLHRLGAALLQRRIVEEGVGARGQDLHRQRRGRGELACVDARLPGFDALQQGDQARQVHRILEAVAQGLRDQRVVRDLALADDVLEAGDLVREHRRQQVLGAHALQRRWHLAAAGEARQRQRGGRVPAPAHAEHRRVQQRLHQHLRHRVRMQVAGDVGERETVAGRQRQHDRIVGRGRLQLEVEAPAEALAQRQAPGAVEARAEGRVDDQLGAAGLVEETLHDEVLLRRQGTERGLRGRQVIGELARRGGADAGLRAQPLVQPLRSRQADGLRWQQRHGLRAQPRDRRRQRIAASGRLGHPEGNRRCLSARVLDPHLALADAADAVALVAELKHIARQAFDREVLVDRADADALRLQQHLVVGGVGDRAAAGQRGHARAATGAQHAVDRVAVQVRGARPAAGGVALGQHPHQRAVVLARQPRIGKCAAHPFVQRALRALAARDFGDDLLRQHVQRRLRHAQGLQFAAADRGEQGDAFDQVVARGREQPSLGQPAQAVAGAADPLQEGGDRARRAELADEVHIADVDAEFQRRGRHQHRQLAALQTLLGVEAALAREAAVVRGDAFGAEQLGEMPRGALGHAPGVDEDQGAAVRAHQIRQARVDLGPDLVRHHRRQRRARQFQREVARTRLADVDDRAVGRAVGGDRRVADQKTRGLGQRALGRRQADPRQAPAAQRIQPFQRQREVRAALVAGERVDLVDDHAACAGEHRPPGLRSEQDVQRLRRGHEDVRRALAPARALGLRGVAAAHGAADRDRRPAEGLQFRRDPRQRAFQVQVHIVRQRLQRRDVDHPRAVVEGARKRLAREAIECVQEGGEGLAGTGRRGDQRVPALRDGRPGGGLRRGRRVESLREPARDGGMEGGERHAGSMRRPAPTRWQQAAQHARQPRRPAPATPG